MDGCAELGMKGDGLGWVNETGRGNSTLGRCALSQCMLHSLICVLARTDSH